MTMHKLSLTPVERIIIADFYPKGGTRQGQRIIKSIDDMVAFSDEELEQLGMRTGLDPTAQKMTYSFDGGKAPEDTREFEFSDTQMRALRDEIARVEKNNGIDFRRNLELADKIMDIDLSKGEEKE